MTEPVKIEEHIKNPLTETEIQSLKGLFGERASFRKEENDIFVNTKLSDGIAEGGQDIQLRLSEKKLISKTTHDEWVNAFSTKEISINGVDMTNDINQIFFEVRKEKGPRGASGTLSQERIEERKTGHSLNDHSLETYGTSVVPVEKGKGNIFITSFKNVDDLIKIFHEDGHVNDPDFYTSNFIKIRSDHWMDKMFLSEIDNNDMTEIAKKVETWKSVVRQEIVADKNALQKIISLSTKVNIFGKDSETEFVRVKKSLESMVTSYVNTMDGWFKNRLTSRELSNLIEI